MHAACSQETRQKKGVKLVQTVLHLVEQRKQRNGCPLRALEEGSGGEDNRLRDCR